MPISVSEVCKHLYRTGFITCEIISFNFAPQYKIGQLYMIAKHSNEQSAEGEGVEVVANEPHEDPQHGVGQYTEKRIYLFRYAS